MPKAPLRILIVDDCAEDRRQYIHLLRSPDGEEYREVVVFEAETGTAGKEFCRKENPHCVIFDAGLTDLDGPHFMMHLRGSERSQGYPAVIVLTNQGNEAVAAEALKKGAEDYLVREQITAETLRASLRRAISAVKRRQRSVQAKKKLRRTAAQLHAARDIQQLLLPWRPPTVSGFEIAGYCQPADETGGDFYDFPPVCDGTVGVVVGDVSGHGLGPAILAADTRAYLRAFAQMEAAPGQIVVLTDRLLCQDTKGERFVTLFFATLNSRTRRVRFAAAGHRAFLFSRSGNLTTVESPQPPLGMDIGLVTGIEHSITMQVGDVLFLMTDGISDAVCTHDQPRSADTMFGESRALEIVRGLRDNSADAIIKGLIQEVHAFTDSRVQDDDMTAVVIKAV